MFYVLKSNKKMPDVIITSGRKKRGTTQFVSTVGADSISARFKRTNTTLKALTLPPSRTTQSKAPSPTPLASYLQRQPIRTHTNRALSLKGHTAYSSRSKRFYITVHFNTFFSLCQLFFYIVKQKTRTLLRSGFGAGNQNRTDDLVITNDVLYRLSHTSKPSVLTTCILYQTKKHLSIPFFKFLALFFIFLPG